MKTWKCEVCGYVHQGDAPPRNCPICGVDSDRFSPLVVAVAENASVRTEQWRCSICDHLHDGDSPPERCIICGATANLFEAVVADPQLCGTADSGRILIVGGGIAGLTAAEEARKCSEQADIILICKEAGLPYYRLNLTRFLAGEVSPEQLPMQQTDWFAERRIELLEGEVMEIDRAARTVRLRDGRRLDYQRLVLTSGAHPFIPPVPGATRDGVFSLRTLQDARRILERLQPKLPCAVIGGGLLGLETAGALARRGAKVTVFEGYPWLMPRQLPEQAGRLLQAHLESLGIEVICGAKVQELTGDEQLHGVLLADGSSFAAELAIVSAGVRPNSYLARQADLKVKSGVIVDDRMTTSDPAIFAAGDLAEHRGQLYGIWPASYAQGMVAGINASGGHAEFPGLSLATRIKVLDIDLFSIGQIQPTDASYQLLERNDGHNYCGLVCRDSQLVGAALFGDTSQAGLLKDAIELQLQLPEQPELLERFPELRSALA